MPQPEGEALGQQSKGPLLTTREHATPEHLRREDDDEKRPLSGLAASSAVAVSSGLAVSWNWILADVGEFKFCPQVCQSRAWIALKDDGIAMLPAPLEINPARA